MKTGVALPKQCFVNNRNIHEYDYKDLITQLITDIPDLKKETLIFPMSSLAKKIIDEKHQLLKKREYPTAIKATSVSVLHGDRVYNAAIAGSIFDVDIGALLLEAKFYQKQFGTNDESLKIIADRLNISFDDFILNLTIVTTSVVQSEDSFMQFFSMLKKQYKAKRGLLVVPISAIPLCMFVQRQILNMCYNEASRVLAAQHKRLSTKMMITLAAGENGTE
ncbi:hypothetical protein DPMN_172626 [Dreissena polymorpha]|uniref:Uncharacterized protein n=1 Tax=Dreissena polymorpha TaxID=45954 RepID=A0A9D4E069_DREPO|nr:hypothetical protein DPMN_172626 [Dreissena polymorpha]